MSDIATFLSQLTLFENLNEAELADLAPRFREYDYPEGGVVAYQRDVADRLFIVREGRLLSVRVDGDGRSESVQRYMAGQWFGDSWLFTTGTYPATVRAARPSRVLAISRSDFLNFLDAHPDVLDFLDLSPDAEEQAHQSRLALTERRYGAIRLAADELVKFESRRSIWLLVLRLIVPGLLTLILPLLVFLIISSYVGWARLGLAGGLLVLLPIVLMGLWALFLVADWQNDYFLITTRHVIHYELDLWRFRSSISKSPISQIQSVEIDTPNVFARLFDVGTARITTAAQSTQIYFDFIDNPHDVQETIDALQAQVKELDAGREQEELRRSIEGYFDLPPVGTEVKEPVPAEAVDDDEEEEDEEDEEELEEAGFSWSELLVEILFGFTSTFRTRVEKDGVVTYRKHPLVLLREIRWPGLVLVGLALVGLVLFYFGVRLPLAYYGLPFLAVFLWLVWQAENWRNDQFQLTDRYIIDIDRKPFGFQESRKQTELSNVQNATADKPNVWATIFNYGSVTVETAGIQADIMFEDVANPQQIQGEIFARRAAYEAGRRQQEQEARRHEYAVLLDVYKQATELGRIPARTPSLPLQEYEKRLGPAVVAPSGEDGDGESPPPEQSG